MDVSIIIVNYNSAEFTINAIRSIKDKTKKVKYEIIVVDNASKDNSAEELYNEFGSDICIISSKTNLGYGRANNLAAKTANGKYLFFLNPDTVLINNAIYHLFSYLEKNKQIGVAGGNLFSVDMCPNPSYCYRFDDLKSEKKASSWMNIIFNKARDTVSRHYPKTDSKKIQGFNYSGKPLKVAYVFGSDLMISKELFNKAGEFDKDIFMYSEEQLLTWNALKLGYYCVNVPRAQIIHLEGETSKDSGHYTNKYYSMRLNGIMIYYYKRFGKKGLQRFYHLRAKRYKRVQLIHRLHHGKLKNSVASLQLKCLEEEYVKICNYYHFV